MKLLRFGPSGSEKPGLLDAEGQIRDLSGVVDDIAGDVLSAEGLAKIAAIDPATLPLAPAGSRYGPCVGRVGKFICIGLNYADHAAESNLPVPEEPVLFMKAITSLNGFNFLGKTLVVNEARPKTDAPRGGGGGYRSGGGGFNR